MTAKKGKKVALTMRIEEHRYPQSSEWRDAISHDWLVLLQELNLDPILVPNRGAVSSRYLEGVDGLILTGGGDLSADQSDSGRYHERDKTEVALLDQAAHMRLPVLGVCRGMQAINRYFGGTLAGASSEHLAREHQVQITEYGAELFGELRSLTVNSYHQNRIDTLGSELLVMAHAEDSTIEALRHRDLPILGVMWHPERECSEPESHQAQRALVQGVLSIT